VRPVHPARTLPEGDRGDPCPSPTDILVRPGHHHP